jgi:serine/threonine-protein kinase
LIVAVLVAWFLISDGDAGGREASAAPIGSAPAGGGVSVAPTVSGGRGSSLPSVTGKPGQPVIAGSGSPSATGPVKTSGPPAAGQQNGSDQKEDDPPTSPPTTTTTIGDPPGVDPPPNGTRLTVSGGAVYATCSTLTATLTGWEPASGFTVADVEAGPALSTMIVFASDDARYRATVTCVAGSPTSVVLPL